MPGLVQCTLYILVPRILRPCTVHGSSLNADCRSSAALINMSRRGRKVTQATGADGLTRGGRRGKHRGGSRDDGGTRCQEPRLVRERERGPISSWVRQARSSLPTRPCRWDTGQRQRGAINIEPGLDGKDGGSHKGLNSTSLSLPLPIPPAVPA